MPPWPLLLGWYAGASLLSLAAYWRDKRRARRGLRRTRERTLLLIDLAGGWPGGLAAQRLFRHKTRDRTFQIRFVAVVLVHAGLLALIAFGR